MEAENMNIIGPRISQKKSRVFDSICPQEKFLELVRRERLRTHRNNIPFSVLTFEKANGSRENKVFEDLIKVLLQRLRATDEVGWKSDRKIGLLLPNTLQEGADVLAKNIMEKINKPSQLVYEIQSYPILTVLKTPSANQPENKIDKDNSDNGGKNGKNENSELDEIFTPPMPAWKRGLDILLAGVSLVILFPIFLVIAAFIKILSPGPVFFKQVRVGFRKKPFICWKFRTMRVEADTTVHKEYLKSLIKNENKSMKKLDNADPRIIPFGKILRNTGLDELPQLVNILMGDMSLVGPRPCTTYEASEYSIWQHRRFDTKPGLTGLWQVSGKNRTSFVEMMRLDIGYAISKTLLKDIWIIIKTFPALVVQVVDCWQKKK
jgi:lipopolysaccharide/colanic/teichoic acid biosynthesis glycosyltransferase